MTTLPKRDVHNAGFVELVDHMGSDLSVVNAARVSMGKHKDVFDESDAKLIKYLAKMKHGSPFRHAYMTFHIKAPIFVFRQWMKHQIGCAWDSFNEISGRYVDLSEADFFIPDTLRKGAASIKQGSLLEPVDEHKAALNLFLHTCKDSLKTYNALLRLGVCKEQARTVLPQGMYSEVYWTVSLQALAHFFTLRLDSHAQLEIREYAQAVYDLAKDLYPVSLQVLMETENDKSGKSS